MRNVTVHYDYASPWAFVVSEIAERELPGIPLTWIPTYLRGLESFATGLPYTSAKLAYVTREVSDRTVAAALLAEAIGTTSAEAEAAMTDASVKTKLRENTEQAAARGVFGTPTFFVGVEMFWGHDRMGYVRREAQKT